MRLWVMGWLLLAAGVAQGGEVEHVRGDYRFWVAPVPAFVEQRTVPDDWPADAPGVEDNRWRYWLHDVQADRRTGADAVYEEHAYEPRAASMLGEAGKYQVTFNPEYQRLLIHRVQVRRDGTWHDRLVPERISLARRETGFEQDLANGSVTALIVLDDVRVGDVVRVAYTITGSNPILAGQSSDWAHLGWISPQLDNHLRVLYDPGTEPGVHLENGAPAPRITRGPDAVEVELHAHATGPIVNQDAYPVWYQPFPLAQVAERRSWADVVAWALPLYPPVQTLPADLEALVAQWKAVDDPHERLRLALRTVQDDVRYFGVEIGDNTHRPVAPGVTWDRRYGDCKDKAYLLVTLLDRLGIQAQPALVSVDRGRALADYVPTAAAFDHVIVRAVVGGDVAWVDPTMTEQGGAPLDSQLASYGVALPVAPGVEALEAIAPRDAANGIATVERFVHGGKDRPVELEIRTTYRGKSADIARRNLAGQRIEDLSRRYADYYRKRYGPLEVLEHSSIQDDREGNVLVVSERYALESPFDAEGAAIAALEVYGESLQGISALPQSVVRNGPLAFAAEPAVYRHEVRLQMPGDWDPAFGDESIRHASPAFTYQRELDVGDEGVSLVYEMAVAGDDVPLESAEAHLRELRDARESLSMRLRFHAPERLGDQERKDRLEALLRNALEGETP